MEQIRPEVCPDLVWLQRSFPGFAEEICPYVIECAETHIAAARNVERRQVEGETNQEIPYGIDDELVDLVAHLLLGALGEVCRANFSEHDGVEECLDEAEVRGLVGSVRQTDRIRQHRMAEPVNGLGKLQTDRRIDLYIVLRKRRDVR